SFAAAHYLSAGEKLRVAYGLLCLKREAVDADSPFLEWLRTHYQTQRTIDRFWGLVLTSALNETPERIGLRYTRKAFVEAFLGPPRGFEVELPSVPLGRLYGPELEAWLESHRVEVRLQEGAKAFAVADGRVEGLALRQGDEVRADWYVSAVPFDRLLDL